MDKPEVAADYLTCHGFFFGGPVAGKFPVTNLHWEGVSMIISIEQKRGVYLQCLFIVETEYFRAMESGVQPKRKKRGTGVCNEGSLETTQTCWRFETSMDEKGCGEGLTTQACF